MQHHNVWALTGLVAALGLPLPLAAQAVAEVPQASSQPVVVGLSSSSATREASLSLFLSDGTTRVIALREGRVLIDGDRVASYSPGGDVDLAFRKLVAWTAELSPDAAVAAMKDWRVEGAFDAEGQAALEALWGEFAGLSAAESVPVPPQPPEVGELAEAEVALADARAELRRARDEIRESIRNNVRVQVRPDPRIHIDVVPSRSHAVSPLAGVATGAAGLGGAFLALIAIAFGVSSFAGRQIDVMADTVSTSLGRSFFVGLFAQPLILPAFVATIVGLAMTVVGILVIPFAAVAFVAALTAAVLGGYLAVARVAGSAWVKRVRGGDQGAIGLVRSTAWGLAIILGIWLPAVLLGWIPLVGDALTLVAAIVTWAMMTTGLGAAILTRGGVRTTFGRKFRAPELPAATLYEQADSEISTGEWLSGRVK